MFCCVVEVDCRFRLADGLECRGFLLDRVLLLQGRTERAGWVLSERRRHEDGDT